MVVGHDFSFGKKAMGDIPFLKRIGAKMGFFVECVDPVMYRGGRDIEHLHQKDDPLRGCMPGQARLMKFPFRHPWAGGAWHVQGQRLGFPTANVQTDKELIPAYGVYAVYIYLEDK